MHVWITGWHLYPFWYQPVHSCHHHYSLHGVDESRHVLHQKPPPVSKQQCKLGLRKRMPSGKHATLHHNRNLIGFGIVFTNRKFQHIFNKNKEYLKSKVFDSTPFYLQNNKIIQTKANNRDAKKSYDLQEIIQSKSY